MTSLAAKTLLTNIGELVTNEPAPGREGGPLGILRDAAVLIEGERVTWVGKASEVPDGGSPGAQTSGRSEPLLAGSSDGRHSESRATVTTRLGASLDTEVVVVDAGGSAVVPGFVDSHTHLVFAGDRAPEFEARMAGRPYAAGGIRTTVAATRVATEEHLRARLASLVAEARAQGTTTLEVKSGYGLDVGHEERLVRLAAEVTHEVTFLGAHVVPIELAATPDRYVDLVVGEMLEACAPHARWIDVFCEEGAFTVAQSRRILEAGLAAGLRPRIHAGQLGLGDGVRMAVEVGAASVDHATFLSDDDVEALAGSSTVATFLPGAEFSTRQPYPDARRLLDAGVTVALASDCNPGSSFTTSMPFMVALAVREMGMTPAEALWAATAGGARALDRSDVGRIAPGCRADLVQLAAPSYVHLAYRPGVPLITRTWLAGNPTLNPSGRHP